MCTLIALWKYHPSAPLVLALNRDELFARPTAPAMLWDGPDPRERIVAGKDLRSGGTWFGVGRRVVAALTNHRSSIPSRAGVRSRGDLVVRALRCENVAEVKDEIGALPPGEFGPFHLLACDADSMIWITNRSGEFEAIPVSAGAHVLGNYGLDNESDSVVATLHGALKGADSMSEADLGIFLKNTLSRRAPGWPCVELGPYGTRNSAILWWGREKPTLWETDGPPDRAPWMDRSDLLSQLGK